MYCRLPGVTWAGSEEQARDQAFAHGCRFYTCQAVKTFLEMTVRSQHFPTPQYRQCTSDLKRGPLEKLMRQLSKELDRPLLIDCQGLAARESPDRAKLRTWKRNPRLSKAGRTAWTWLAVHNYSLAQVWASQGHTQEDLDRRRALWRAGDRAAAVLGWNFHWAYVAGMSRLSCCFCIYSSDADLVTAAELEPEKLADIVAVEKEIGHTFKMPRKGQQPRTLDVVIAEIQARA
jgi:3'-phosphoadenosine 5'-phosphosulfate sulfotransferase (PAPS reductase)/FAD synthetase